MSENLCKLAKLAHRVTRAEKEARIQEIVAALEEAGATAGWSVTLEDIASSLYSSSFGSIGRPLPTNHATFDEHDKQRLLEMCHLLQERLDPPLTGTIAAASSEKKAQSLPTPPEPEPADPQTTSAQSDRETTVPKWCRAAKETCPTDIFPHGPLIGTQKDLAACLHDDGKRNPRRLHDEVDLGTVWVRKRNRYRYELFFKHKEDYERASQRLLHTSGSGSQTEGPA